MGLWELQEGLGYEIGAIFILADGFLFRRFASVRMDFELGVFLLGRGRGLVLHVAFEF
jgi:hypothetical protein